MSKLRSPITTHILDTAIGKPASNVSVVLEKQEGALWKVLAKGNTNQDGRIEDLLTPGSVAELGIYKMTFETAAYYSNQGFYPYVSIVFEIKKSNEHYHVPLLLTPHGYSTYRGS